MTDVLFVYGTLRRAAAAASLGRDMRARLEADAVWLGLARMPGCLFDLGDYPAMRAPEAPGDVVRGELYRLADPAAAFRWLDPYEGIAEGLADPEYRRAIQIAQCDAPQWDGARSVEAWVYLYRRPLAAARRIADGEWQP